VAVSKRKKRSRGANGLPWLRRDRMQFYVTDPDTGRKSALVDRNGHIVRWDDSQTPAENQDRANAVWYESQRLRQAGLIGEENEVRVVLEQYLQKHVEKSASAKALDDYTRWFKSFLARWPGIRVRDLSADHIETWWAECHPNWGQSMRNLVGSVFKAGLNWAAARNRGKPLIPVNPIRDWKLPPMKKRSAKTVVTGEEFQKVLATVESERVRDVLEVLWESGTRPVNLTRATAAHIATDGRALVFDEHNTPAGAAVHKTFKRTGQALIVPLTPRARDIVLRLAKEHPAGPLFRSPRGLPWTPSLLANTIRNYSTKVGLNGRFVAYSARHTLATELLEDGRTSTEGAAVLGNTPKVVERNYSHVAAQATRLCDLLKHRADRHVISVSGSTTGT
jgi:integrase